MTPFQESFSTKQLLPPWQSDGCQFWGILVEIQDKNLISNYLDEFFNDSYPDRAPFTYRPLDGRQFGLLIVEHHQKTYSLAPNKPKYWDSLEHIQVYWTFPVNRRRITPENLIVDSTVWVQPFAFDSNPIVVFGAREIWGSDMNIAKIFMETGMLPGQLHLDVAVNGTKVFSPSSVSEWLACMHIRFKNEVAQENLKSVEGAVDTAADFLKESGLLPDSSGALVLQPRDLDIVKQYRDTYVWTESVYRALVSARTTYGRPSDLRLYAADSIQLDFLWSDSIKNLLERMFDPVERQGELSGHPPKDQEDIDWKLDAVPLTPLFGFSLQADVKFEVLETLHTYGG